MAPSFIEVFCGHAGLSLQRSADGFRSHGVDHAHSKDKPVAEHIFEDFFTNEGQGALFKIIRDRKCCYISPHHVAMYYVYPGR